MAGEYLLMVIKAGGMANLYITMLYVRTDVRIWLSKLGKERKPDIEVSKLCRTSMGSIGLC